MTMESIAFIGVLLLMAVAVDAFKCRPTSTERFEQRLMGSKGFGGDRSEQKTSRSGGGGFGGGKNSVASNAMPLKAPSGKKADASSASADFFLNKEPSIAKQSVAAHIPSMNLDYPGIRAVYGDPPVFEVDNIFDEAMCESYIARADTVGKKVQSATFSQLSGSVRTSTTWYLPYAEVPELVEAAEKLTGLPSSHFEEPQIVRYEMGQQFSWHGDSIPKSMQQEGGNRLATFIVYLNTLPSVAGGATAFKDLSIQCKPERGKGLLFFPCYLDGSADDRTFHCGQVAMETKYIAQIWIHERPYKSDMR